MKQYNSILDVQADIKNGVTNCYQLVTYYLDRIKAQQHLNAFLEVFEEEALQQALLIDEKIKTGKAGRLAGMVLGIKDVICYKNHKVSASSKILENFTSLYTATALQRLLDEDVIVIGRLNCDEFAMGASNENSAFGNVLNALDTTRVPGGSSGGSAVAVQADLCLASLGTDTGGSIRQPASLTGVVGMKPTYGRISRYGLIAYASSFDQIGALTRSIYDAALLTEIMSGKDKMDATTSVKKVESFSSYVPSNKKYKIAFLKDAIEHQGLDKNIKKHTLELIQELKENGHILEGVAFPEIKYVVPTYYLLTTAEASSNLARYDGVHFGYRSDLAKDMDATYKKSRTEGFGKEVKRRIMLGTYVLSAGYYDAYYLQAQKVRRIITDRSLEILREYDFILLPTTPTTAFKIGEKSTDPLMMYLADIFTVQANLAGIPAISLPMYQHENGMPFGIQLIANKFEESKLFSFSNQLMKEKVATYFTK